ncbi:MAG: 30S ribosomal protein S20 [Candidatus Pacebacteria bacterium]|nr:30S ribosomal protein S20 [Candidatus Paceibacterota bacterium]
MPVTKTTKRRVSQNLRKKVINQKRTLKMRGLLKEANVLVLGKSKEDLKKMLPEIYKAIDKAAKIGVIKKNTAARKKSRITKKIDAIK